LIHDLDCHGHRPGDQQQVSSADPTIEQGWRPATTAYVRWVFRPCYLPITTAEMVTSFCFTANGGWVRWKRSNEITGLAMKEKTNSRVREIGADQTEWSANSDRFGK
jgi:hypothetical protein